MIHLDDWSLGKQDLWLSFFREVQSYIVIKKIRSESSGNYLGILDLSGLEVQMIRKGDLCEK